MNTLEIISVTKERSLKEALERLNQSQTAILLLIDDNGALDRTITDGDIRRLLLAGKTLEDTLVSLEKSSAVVVKDGLSDTELLNLMDEYQVKQIPVVDDDNKPIGLHLRHNLEPRIQLSIPHMGDHELRYVEEAFQTNWIAPVGPNIDAFEKEIASYVGIKYAAAVSSGTAAIHLALRLLDIGPGDLVLCSSFTFIASANPILYQGATPVFIDSEPQTWNMSHQALEKALKACCEKGEKPKAILVVHIYGQSAEMEKIIALSKAYDVPIVEDAAESLGALYKGKHTGTFGKFGIFSFNGNKIITTSGGGMLISDDRKLIERARFLSTQAKDSAPHYEHSEIGYNYRMSNILAGIGRGQLEVLDDRVNSRRGIFYRYKEALSHIGCIDWMPEPEDDFSNHWLSAISLNPQKTQVTPKMLIDALAGLNIEARPVWKPMHLQPLFKDSLYFRHHDKQSYCDYLFETAICLPSASNMSMAQQDSVIHHIQKILNGI